MSADESLIEFWLTCTVEVDGQGETRGALPVLLPAELRHLLTRGGLDTDRSVRAGHTARSEGRERNRHQRRQVPRQACCLRDPRGRHSRARGERRCRPDYGAVHAHPERMEGRELQPRVGLATTRQMSTRTIAAIIPRATPREPAREPARDQVRIGTLSRCESPSVAPRDHLCGPQVRTQDETTNVPSLAWSPRAVPSRGQTHEDDLRCGDGGWFDLAAFDKMNPA